MAYAPTVANVQSSITTACTAAANAATVEITDAATAAAIDLTADAEADAVDARKVSGELAATTTSATLQITDAATAATFQLTADAFSTTPADGGCKGATVPRSLDIKTRTAAGCSKGMSLDTKACSTAALNIIINHNTNKISRIYPRDRLDVHVDKAIAAFKNSTLWASFVTSVRGRGDLHP